MKSSFGAFLVVSGKITKAQFLDIISLQAQDSPSPLEVLRSLDLVEESILAEALLTRSKDSASSLLIALEAMPGWDREKSSKFALEYERQQKGFVSALVELGFLSLANLTPLLDEYLASHAEKPGTVVPSRAETRAVQKVDRILVEEWLNFLGSDKNKELRQLVSQIESQILDGDLAKLILGEWIVQIHTLRGMARAMGCKQAEAVFAQSEEESLRCLEASRGGDLGAVPPLAENASLLIDYTQALTESLRTHSSEGSVAFDSIKLTRLTRGRAA